MRFLLLAALAFVTGSVAVSAAWVTDKIGCLPHWIEGHPGTAAWVQAVGSIILLAIAIGVPLWQQRTARVADRQAKAAELSSLRLALQTEVGMVSNQCLVELRYLLDGGSQKNPRTARLPPLVIFEANAEKVGLLTRGEIIHLIGFSGTLHDLSVMATNEMTESGGVTPMRGSRPPPIETDQGDQGSREILQVLLSNACGHAADFFEAVGIDDEDRPFIDALKRAHNMMDGVRSKPTDLP